MVFAGFTITSFGLAFSSLTLKNRKISYY